MLSRIFAAAILAVFVCALSPGLNAQKESAPAAQESLQDRIDRLVKDLGSEDYNQRAAAKKELIEIGEDARDAIEEALKSADPEVVFTIRIIIKTLDKLPFIVRCIDESGAPIAEKPVAVLLSTGNYSGPMGITMSGTMERKGKTSKGGLYASEPVNYQVMSLTAEIDGYAPSSIAPMRYMEGRQIITLTFAKGGDVSGLVVDPNKGGAPVSGVRLLIGGENATTNQKGEFSISNLPVGRYRVNFDAPPAISRQRFDQYVTVEAGKTTAARLEIAADDKNRCGIHCPIVQPDGTPLPDAPVALLTKSADRPSDSSCDIPWGAEDYYMASKEGVFTYGSIIAGRRTVIVLVPGYKPVNLGVHEFKPGEIWEIKDPLTLDKGLSLEVTVKDADGRPVPNANILLHRVASGVATYDARTLRERHAEVSASIPRFDRIKSVQPGFFVANNQGVASISGLEEGEYAVLAGGEGYAISKCTTAAVKKDETAKIETTLERATGAIIFVADSGTGNGLPNCVLEVRPKEQPGGEFLRLANLDEDRPLGSQFNLNNVQPGANYLIVASPGFATACAVVDFKAGDRPTHQIPLQKLGTGALKGKIVPSPSASLKDVAGALLYLVRTSGEQPGPSVAVPTFLPLSRDGSFSVGELQEGPWAIAVKGRGDRLLGETVVEVVKGATAEANVAIADPGALEVFLRDADGKAVEGALLGIRPAAVDNGCDVKWTPPFLTTTEPIVQQDVLTDAEGKAEFAPQTPGAYRVVYFKRGDGAEKRTAQTWNAAIDAGRKNSTRLALAKGATIEGRIADNAAGDVSIALCLNSANIMDNSPPPAALLMRLKAGEKFKLDGVAPGKYVLFAASESDGSRTFTREIEVIEGKPVPEIVVEPAVGDTRAFAGSIKNYQPPFHRRHLVVLSGKICVFVEVAPDGTFKGRALPGAYKLFLVTSERTTRGADNERKPVDVNILPGGDQANIEIP